MFVRLRCDGISANAVPMRPHSRSPPEKFVEGNRNH
jgi:hypothetical protein